MQSSFKIVGILNTTPDSFYDGGKYNVSITSAVARATEMIEQGADIIDVGGESTGPGSKDVPMEEEIVRTIDVIDQIHRAHPDVGISIDTYKSDVALSAIEVGATIVNDVTAGRGDERMIPVIADKKCQYVMMYSKDPTPRTTIEDVEYVDILESLNKFFIQKIIECENAGLAKHRLILDPGLGHFLSSDPKYSFEVLARLYEFGNTFELPVYVSPSRKSFLAGKQSLPVSERLPATIAASAIAVLHGAQYIRTHDVLEVKRGCEIAAQFLRY